MSTTAITAAGLSFETASANLGVFGAASNTAGAAATTGGSAVATTPADGWVISPATGRSLADGLLLLIFSTDATLDTFTITAGDRPPSMSTGLGAKTVDVAANNTKVIAVDVSRHLQDDGTIVVTCTDAGANLAAVMLPRGA
jgi:hypothetical protein